LAAREAWLSELVLCEAMATLLELRGCPNCHLKSSEGSYAYVGIDCPVCLQQTASPSVILPCGHLFCPECFEAMGGVVEARRAMTDSPKSDAQPGVIWYVVLGAILSRALTSAVWTLSTVDTPACDLIVKAEGMLKDVQSLLNATMVGESNLSATVEDASNKMQVSWLTFSISCSIALAAVGVLKISWRLVRQRFLMLADTSEYLWDTFASLCRVSYVIARVMTIVATLVASACNALSSILLAVLCSAR